MDTTENKGRDKESLNRVFSQVQIFVQNPLDY